MTVKNCINYVYIFQFKLNGIILKLYIDIFYSDVIIHDRACACLLMRRSSFTLLLVVIRNDCPTFISEWGCGDVHYKRERYQNKNGMKSIIIYTYSFYVLVFDNVDGVTFKIHAYIKIAVEIFI